MALKPITRQEQIIVGKNLEPITRMERFLKEYGGGSGGGTQSDWNQTDSSAADFIKNKPFGDMPTGGDTLYWDGNTEGLEVYNNILFKVSDKHITREQLANGYSTVIYEDGGFQNITFEDDRCVLTVEEELLFFMDEEEAQNDGIPFAICNSSGVWLADLRSLGMLLYVASLTIPGYTGFPVTKKIEEKYLPGAVILYADAEAEGYLYSTNDTSDTSKRMTKAELLKVLQSGNAVYLHYLDFAYCLAVTFIDLGDSMGVGFAISGEYVNAHTAEYVPEG